MIAVWWVVAAFAVGGCAGVFLSALLRTAGEESLNPSSLADCRKLRRPPGRDGQFV